MWISLFCKVSVQYKLLQLQKILQTIATTKAAATAQTTAVKHTESYELDF